MGTSGYVYLIILAVAASLSQWLLTTVETALRRQLEHNDLPTLYVDAFTISRMNEQGLREYTLTAPRLVRLPDPQGSQVERPVLNLYLEDGQTIEWIIESEMAWVTPDRDQVRLEGAVTMSRPAASGRSPMVITTTRVLVNPDAGTAETAEPVRLESPNGWVTAVGAKAFLHDKRVEMHSQVREYYVKPPKD